MDNVEFTLPVTTPFRLDLTAWALRRRGGNIVDQWSGGRYSRVLVDRDRGVRVVVVQPGAAAQGVVVTLRSEGQIDDQLQGSARALVQKMFGLSADLTPFYRLAKGDVLLNDLAAEFAGVRPPRFPSMFEALVNSVACQQVSLESGIATLNRLAQKFGVPMVDDGAAQYSFPQPIDLIPLSEEHVKSVGFSRQKARAILGLARLFAEDGTDFAHLDQLTNGEAVADLTAIPGIGRWSAEYVLLRGLGRLDSFPGDDVGAQNNLQRLFERETRPTYDEIRTLVAGWSPYQGFVYFHLLLEKLRAKGVL